MTKHTPGPWWYDRTDDDIIEILDKNSAVIALVHRTEANARLIAAAPALLAACEAAIDALLDCQNEFKHRQIDNMPIDTEIDMCRSAIAQAKGE